MLSVIPENQLFNPSFGVGEFPDVANCNIKCTAQPHIHRAPSWHKRNSQSDHQTLVQGSENPKSSNHQIPEIIRKSKPSNPRFSRSRQLPCAANCDGKSTHPSAVCHCRNQSSIPSNDGFACNPGGFSTTQRPWRTQWSTSSSARILV